MDTNYYIIPYRLAIPATHLEAKADDWTVTYRFVKNSTALYESCIPIQVLRLHTNLYYQMKNNKYGAHEPCGWSDAWVDDDNIVHYSLSPKAPEAVISMETLRLHAAISAAILPQLWLVPPA